MSDIATAERIPGLAANKEDFSFSGSASDYFRIWIVNLCLTIVTLGIYSPWAKVRRNKYLYGHSHLAGASFDYHARPAAILKGRLIAIAMLAVYLVTSAVAPLFSLVIGLLIALAVPWLLVRSRMFAMHNTSYRNVRFRFPPIYKQAYKVIVGYFLLTIITLGLGYAWAHYHRSKLIVDNTSFGTVRMKLNERIGGSDFFMVYLGAGALLLLAGIGVALVIGVLTPLLGTPEMTGTGENQPLLGVMVSVGAPLLFYVALFLGTAAAILRLILRNTDIGGNQLICNWSLPRLGFIYLTNLIAILLSFGLLIPWATIRIRRYKLAQLQLALGGEDLSTVIAAQTEDVSALGDEIGEAFDYDFGL